MTSSVPEEGEETLSAEEPSALSTGTGEETESSSETVLGLLSTEEETSSFVEGLSSSTEGSGDTGSSEGISSSLLSGTGSSGSASSVAAGSGSSSIGAVGSCSASMAMVGRDGSVVAGWLGFSSLGTGETVSSTGAGGVSVGELMLPASSETSSRLASSLLEEGIVSVAMVACSRRISSSLRGIQSRRMEQAIVNGTTKRRQCFIALPPPCNGLWSCRLP